MCITDCPLYISEVINLGKGCVLKLCSSLVGKRCWRAKHNTSLSTKDKHLNRENESILC